MESSICRSAISDAGDPAIVNILCHQEDTVKHLEERTSRWLTLSTEVLLPDRLSRRTLSSFFFDSCRAMTLCEEAISI